MNRIWLVAEHNDGEVAPAALELARLARNLAEVVEAVTWGGNSNCLAPVLGEHGVTTLFDVGDLGDSLPGPSVAAAMASNWADEGAPAAVLLPTTYNGRDVAARLSARTDRPVLSNAVALAHAGGSLVSTHSMFGGEKLVRARFTDEGPKIYLVRPKSYLAEPVQGGVAKVVPLPVPDLARTDAAKVVARHSDARRGPNLEEAQVVVAGGRGMADKERFGLIEELAELLGGAPAASRAVVDAGWAPYAYQVGQTGKTVKPQVYLAFGISGASQHLVGMKSAKHIVAINKDASAPIFQIADLGVIGDIHRVLPELIELLKSRSPADPG